MATLNEFKELILVISASLSMLSVGVGVILAVLQYRLKLKEEERLAISTRADVDVRLFKSFTELMDLAMGRRQHTLSEKAVEELFKRKIISKADFGENFRERQAGSGKLSEYATVVIPVGRSGQHAAMAAIATLAREYPVLKEAAIEGLKSVNDEVVNKKEVAVKYLTELQR